MATEKRVKLRLQKPFGKTLIWGFIYLAGMVLLLEWGARSEYVQGKVPFQAYGTNHIQFEIQLNKYNSYVEINGAPECLIVGNSTSHRALDPEIIGQRYKELTGSRLECFNFSVDGANVDVMLQFAEILIANHKPNIIIFGTSFIDYSEKREASVDDRFYKNPWLLYQTGEFSNKGWLLTNSYAYRGLTFISYGTSQYTTFEEIYTETQSRLERITPTGYMIFRKVFDISSPVQDWITERLLEELGGFTLSEKNLTALEEIAKFKDRGIQVVFVEMPFHYSLIDLRDEEGNPREERASIIDYVLRVNQGIGDIGIEYGVDYFLTTELELIPDDGWSDRSHLNILGGKIFSKWLAQQIHLAVESGQLEDPRR